MIDYPLTIGLDEDQYFCHDASFINPQESVMTWGDSPQEVLTDFLTGLAT